MPRTWPKLEQIMERILTDDGFQTERDAGDLFIIGRGRVLLNLRLNITAFAQALDEEVTLKCPTTAKR